MQKVIPHLQDIIANPSLTAAQRGWIIGLVGALDFYADENRFPESNILGNMARKALYGDSV